MATQRASQFVTVGLTILLACVSAFGQTPPAKPSPEETAFAAVSEATNPAARMAAAEDFVATFPNSSYRIKVAELVAQYLTILRNPQIAISLLNRARAIFTTPDESEILKPAAIEIYANADRVSDAFDLGAD